MVSAWSLLLPERSRTPINRAVWGNPQQLSDLLTKIPLLTDGEPEETADGRCPGIGCRLVCDRTTVFVDGGMTDYPDFEHGG